MPVPETKEELLDRIKGGTIVHCTTAEQARAVLSFCREMGLRLYNEAGRWLDSGGGLSPSYPNVGFDKFDKWVLRYGPGALYSRQSMEFDDIAPVLHGEVTQDYEIDAEVFDSMFL